MCRTAANPSQIRAVVKRRRGGGTGERNKHMKHDYQLLSKSTSSIDGKGSEMEEWLKSKCCFCTERITQSWINIVCVCQYDRFGCSARGGWGCNRRVVKKQCDDAFKKKKKPLGRRTQ